MHLRVNSDPTARTEILVGREREIGMLEAWLCQVRERGGALLVRGEPGVGKSALLAAASDRAESDGMQVWRLSAVRSEMGLSFAGLHQILRPLLERAHDLSQAHRAVLLASFGMDNSATCSIFTVAVATLHLLAEIARKAPLLITIDDAHWLDSESAEVLGFVARRLGPEPLALLLAVREGNETALLGFKVPEVHLGALDETSAATLLDARAPGLGPRLRQRVLAEAARNPLALVELPVAQQSDRPVFGRPERLPITARLQEVFAEQFLYLPAATRAVLLVASLDEWASQGEIMSAATQMGDEMSTSVDDLVPAVDSGLIEDDHTRITFRHPLIPAAIYEIESAARRRRAHAALATVLVDEPNRRAWHRAASISGPDEVAANELVSAAFGEQALKGPETRVAALERAAELTPNTPLRRQRLLRAAELALDLGQPNRVQRLLSEITPECCGLLDQARVRLIRDALEGGPARDPRAIDSLVDAAIQAESEGETALALKLLQAAAMRSWWADPGPEFRSGIAAAARRVEAPEGDPRVMSILAMIDSEGSRETLFQVVSQNAPMDCDADAMFALGTALHVAGVFDTSIVFLAEALRALRQQGRSWLLPHALAQQAWNAVHAGNFSLATATGEQATEAARRLGQPLWEAAAQAALALIAAIRGDNDSAETRSGKAESLASPMGASAVLADTQLARAMIALGAGRHEEAFEHLQRTFDTHDPAYHHIRSRWRIGELAEAALYVGRTKEAREQLNKCESKPQSELSPRLQVGILCARPLLADDHDAEALFQAALRQDLTSWPLYRARLLLQYGMWLRRHRKIAEARMPLRTARDSFLALGAAPWADRAREELRASRETHHSGLGARMQLTEQELQIADMAAKGLSNREIGQRLYISPRTVGSHLYRIFPKLGISTRAQLAAVLGDTRHMAVSASG